MERSQRLESDLQVLSAFVVAMRRLLSILLLNLALRLPLRSYLAGRRGQVLRTSYPTADPAEELPRKAKTPMMLADDDKRIWILR